MNYSDKAKVQALKAVVKRVIADYEWFSDRVKRYKIITTPITQIEQRLEAHKCILKKIENL